MPSERVANHSAALHTESVESTDNMACAGQRLRQQREARGLEINRVATQLHLRQEIIEALEQDRYDLLPDAVFAVGYLRNYARLLGIDPIPLIAAYHAAMPDPGHPPTVRPTPAAHAKSPQKARGAGRLVVRLIGVALLLTVAAMANLWWQNRVDRDSDLLSEAIPEATDPMLETLENQPEPESPSLTMDTPETEQEPMVSASSPDAIAFSEPETVSAAPEPEQIPLSTAAPEIAPEPEPELQPQPAEPEPTPTSTPAAPPEVALEFTGNCWIEVRGADRKVILTGELRKGDRRVLEGEPPYRFIIGNSSMARLTIDGQPFDLNAHSRGNVARFTLDPNQPE